MPYLPTAQEWLKQSALLLQARPTTARITTKYTLTPPSQKESKSKSKASKTSKPESTEATITTTTPADASTVTAPPLTTRATLILKTYDPVSGVTLKYKTDKAAEVGRLISSLSRLARSMAGLPDLKDDVVMLDAQAIEVVEAGSGVVTPVLDGGAKPGAIAGGQVGGAQGGKKGKKKGKK